MFPSYSPIKSGKLSRDNRIVIASSQTYSLSTGSSRKSVSASKLSTSSSSYSNQILLSKSSSSFSTLLMNCCANRTIVLSRCREGRLCRSRIIDIASLQNAVSSSAAGAGAGSASSIIFVLLFVPIKYYTKYLIVLTICGKETRPLLRGSTYLYWFRFRFRFLFTHRGKRSNGVIIK